MLSPHFLHFARYLSLRIGESPSLSDAIQWGTPNWGPAVATASHDQRGVTCDIYITNVTAFQHTADE